MIGGGGGQIGQADRMGENQRYIGDLAGVIRRDAVVHHAVTRLVGRPEDGGGNISNIGCSDARNYRRTNGDDIKGVP